jgi:hypothetical protein
MNSNRIRLSVGAALALALVGSSSPAFGAASPKDAFKVFYFGNSFCENSIPWFQPTLAKSAGREMQVDTRFGAGWQIWMHVNTFYTKPDGAKKTIQEGDWDAVVIHAFGAHPGLEKNMRTKVFQNDDPPFPEPRDVSDTGSASAIMDVFLAKHPDQGRVFIYSSWPTMEQAGAFAKRVKDEVAKSMQNEGISREEVLKTVKERKLTLEELTPVFRAFDYRKAWLQPYQWDASVRRGQNFHTRDYYHRMMEILKERYPKLWKEKRLALIPSGEVFYALDEKLRAGACPGIESVSFFSRDGDHVRAGLPRYTLGATCVAVMLGIHPAKLDAAIYNDLANYDNAKLSKQYGVLGRAYSHPPDLGQLLEITPERKRVVDETIWEVVTKHPYTNLSK